MLALGDAEEIVRRYDGRDNPIGRSYSRRAFRRLLEPWFRVERLFLHYFPARALPFRVSGPLRRFLDRRSGFMIYASLEKKGPDHGRA
jgi:hypothetical protein